MTHPPTVSAATSPSAADEATPMAHPPFCAPSPPARTSPLPAASGRAPRNKERLWLSPGCLGSHQQSSLFDEETE